MQNSVGAAGFLWHKMCPVLGIVLKATLNPRASHDTVVPPEAAPGKSGCGPGARLKRAARGEHGPQVVQRHGHQQRPRGPLGQR